MPDRTLSLFPLCYCFWCQFIHHLFSVLVSSAEFCVKSAMRMSQIKKLMRPGSKTWESLPPIKKLRFENLASDSHARLDRALVAFDRAR